MGKQCINNKKDVNILIIMRAPHLQTVAAVGRNSVLADHPSPSSAGYTRPAEIPLAFQRLHLLGQQWQRAQFSLQRGDLLLRPRIFSGKILHALLIRMILVRCIGPLAAEMQGVRFQQSLPFGNQPPLRFSPSIILRFFRSLQIYVIDVQNIRKHLTWNVVTRLTRWCHK